MKMYYELPLLYFVTGVMYERRAVERNLIAVGRVASSVAYTLVLVKYRYALHVVAAWFGHARMRAVGYVCSRQSSADNLQRFIIDGHLRRYKFEIITNYYNNENVVTM
jgi:hypothetical protein